MDHGAAQDSRPGPLRLGQSPEVPSGVIFQEGLDVHVQLRPLIWALLWPAAVYGFTGALATRRALERAAPILDDINGWRPSIVGLVHRLYSM
jgi:hypothetical protein